MEEQNALEKKKRCPKGFIRNKEGICVPKVAKPTEKVENDIPTKEKVPKEKIPKEKVPKEKVNTKKVSSKAIGKKVSPKAKTMKKMTKIQAAKLLAERRECIQKFRNNLTIIH
jgi:hypothetical protein